MNISFDRVKSSIAGILGRALEGREISVDEGTDLLHAEGDDLTAVKWVANHFRELKHGYEISFVVTRNINFTNVCHMGCLDYPELHETGVRQKPLVERTRWQDQQINVLQVP